MERAVGRAHFWKLMLTGVFLLVAIFCLRASIGHAQQLPDNALASSQQKDDSHRTWQIGGFAMGGWPPYYEVHTPLLRYYEEIQFYSAGVEAGWMLTAIRGPGFLRGRGEGVAEAIPYWQEHAPGQLNQIYLAGSNTPAFLGGFPAYNQHGASITPVLFRWNFMKTNSSRFVPWAQIGQGILWTTQRFPQGKGNQAVPANHTSRFNFTPQVDFGGSIFVHRNQSINLGVRAIHYTSFGLGEYDPGISIAVEFTAGYSWWK